MSAGEELALAFDGAGARSIGILHRPAGPGELAVLIVVGGPQYRVGPHRHFVELARRLAAAGYPVLRFDHRGIGDNAAPHPGFEQIGPDIAAALAELRARVPEARRTVLWALCDSVPAVCRTAARERDVAGVVLLNPWVRAAESHDRTLMRHYYLRRPLQRDFWTNLLRGRSDLRDFAARLTRTLAARLAGRRAAAGDPSSPAGRIVADLARFRGRVLLVLSGHDVTAREFEAEAAAVPGWPALAGAPRVRRIDAAAADHTFSTRADREALFEATLAWLDGLRTRSAAPRAVQSDTPTPLRARPTASPAGSANS